MRHYPILGVLAIAGLIVIVSAPRAGGQAPQGAPAAPETAPAESPGAAGGEQWDGFPSLGAEAEVGLSRVAELSFPRGFTRQESTGAATVFGRLIAFDPYWVGIESDSGARLWLPRERVAYVLTESRGGIRRGPMHQKPSEKAGE